MHQGAFVMQHMQGQGLDIAPLFEAQSVAVVGASERTGSLGTVILRNLRDAGFHGPIYAVNPRYRKTLGEKCYKSIREIAERVDLAIIVTPAKTVPANLENCGAQGVSAAVVLSAGFREVGQGGRELEDEALSVARRHGVRFIGPNCLGVMRPDIGLDATFSQSMAKPGRIALVSQSGAMCTAMLDWAGPRDIGFSCVISSGIAADVDFGEILDYLVFDAATRAIMLYVKGIHYARRFMSALRAAARAKPIIVMKAGRFSEGGKAAVLHTGALVGSDDVFDAALNRAGVVWVQSYAHFFAVAESLHMGLKTNGPRLAIVANDGGPGVIAADFLVDRGLPLAVLSSRTRAKLDAVLPKAWSGANPVDVHGDASAERYATAVEACLEDDGVDGVLAILVPQALTEPLDVAQAVAELARPTTKPVLSCWMGQASVGRSREHYRAAAIPTFSTPETAIDAFAAAAAYHANQELLLQVPRPVSLNIEADRGGAKLIIESALASGRTVLDIIESKAVLAAFGVPIIRSTPAHEPPEAVAIAEEIGFPVVVKIHSPDITHKSDVGGVRLGVANGEDVRTCSSS
jgi:acetyltransferase